MCCCKMLLLRITKTPFSVSVVTDPEAGLGVAAINPILLMGYLKFNIKGGLEGCKKLPLLFTLYFLFAGKYFVASKLKIVKNGTTALNCFFNLANLKSSLSICSCRQLGNNPFTLCQVEAI